MATLLHIDSSALSQGSVSREVAATFRTAWADKHPDGAVAYRDLATDPVPHLDEAGIVYGTVDPAQRTPEQQAAAALQEELVQELLGADAFLFSVPMYNFSITSTFKAWLDRVLIVGRTVGLPEADLPLRGRPATVIASRGGSYAAGTPREGWDYAEPYLRRVLGDALGLDVTVIVPELTLAHRVPQMADLRDASDASRAAAHEAATAQAHATAAKLVA